MKTFKNLFIVGLFAALSFGQATLTQTTLSSALTNGGVQGTPVTFNVTSATGFVAPSFAAPNLPFGANQSVAYVDREAIFITNVSGTQITGIRGYFGTNANQGHVSGAVIYVGPPDYFGTNDKYGSCTSTTLTVLPVINVLDGNFYNCYSSGQWVNTQNGTMGGQALYASISAFCSGAVGSAATDYLSGAACSSSTAVGVAQNITTRGTLANARFSSSANFLGTGGSTFTVLKNGVATSIVCAPTAATKVCSDTTHSVIVAPGDTVTVTFLGATSDTASNLSFNASIY